MQVLFNSEQSAAQVSCKRESYARVTINDIRWFSSKDAFMGAVCKGFEQLWDQLVDEGDRGQSSGADG